MFEEKIKTELSKLTAKEFALRYAYEITRRPSEFTQIKILLMIELNPTLCRSISNFNDGMHFRKCYMLADYIEKNWESRWAKKFDHK